MKNPRPFFRSLFAAALLVFAGPVIAADSPTADLQALVTKIKGRLSTGANTAAALAPELAEFDTLLAKYSGKKTDEVAQILMVKAALYLEIFQDHDQAIALFGKLKTDFAGTPAASRADSAIASIKAQQETNKIERALAIGAKFPDFAAEPDLSGRKISLADFKGKVVLLDFWATWCGPCVAELPHVLDAYRKHHANGFEIVGISLDRAGDRKKLVDFTKKEGMSWVQIFDGEAGSRLAEKYGVNSIPTTYLIDGNGIIVAKNLRGSALEQEVARALAKR